MGFKKSKSLRESVLRKTLKRSDKRERRKRLSAKVAKLKLEYEDALRTAEMARTAAEMGRTAAQKARTTAEMKRTAAQMAQTAALMAQTAAEMGPTSAEMWRTTARMARTAVEMALTAAEMGPTSAEMWRTTAEMWRTTAETARTYAENAQTALRAAKEAQAAAGQASKKSQSEELTQPSHQESSNPFHGLSGETATDLSSGQSEPSLSSLKSWNSDLINPTVPPIARNAVLSTQLTLKMNALNVSTSD